LNYVREENGKLVIGALCRHDQLANNALICEKCVLLADAASVIADQQVRNRGSIGGSLAHADPSADLPTACSALNADLRIVSRNGSRTIPVNEFFLDFFTTTLKQDEIIKEVSIPIPPIHSGGAYTKLTRGHNDFALVAVATQVSLGAQDTCEEVALAVGGVAPKPMRASDAERILLHQKVDDGKIQEAAHKAAQGLNPTPDPRATSDVKRELVHRLTERSLRAAFSRAHGDL
jgi:carbon-monoxide dehydrogenase medium subunit